jgi:hypothetical protein
VIAIDHAVINMVIASIRVCCLPDHSSSHPSGVEYLQLNPLFSYKHSTEGFALDWSAVKSGRLASGDCKKHIHVWEPQEAGGWQVGD